MSCLCFSAEGWTAEGDPYGQRERVSKLRSRGAVMGQELMLMFVGSLRAPSAGAELLRVRAPVLLPPFAVELKLHLF